MQVACLNVLNKLEKRLLKLFNYHATTLKGGMSIVEYMKVVSSEIQGPSLTGRGVRRRGLEGPVMDLDIDEVDRSDPSNI